MGWSFVAIDFNFCCVQYFIRYVESNFQAYDEMRHGSLFSGIGGFDLAAQWMGWENIFQVEIDTYCQKVLAKNFPDVTRYGDIKKFDGRKYRGTIDILSGGFPCQPYSKVGRRKGSKDSRALWHENLRIIREIKPSWIVSENVIGIESMDLPLVLASLEDENYKTEIYNIPASAVGAWHRRERLWIIANLNGKGLEGFKRDEVHPEEWQETIRRTRPGYWSHPWHEIASDFCRNHDGVPDRIHRIKALGNAVVPQIAFEIFKAIEITNEFSYSSKAK